MSQQLHVRDLADPGKLLILMSAAEKARVEIELDEIETYAMIADEEVKLAFNYTYTFEPGPYSDELRGDLRTLAAANYIEISSPLRMLDRGSDWILSELPRTQDGIQVYDALTSLVRKVAHMTPTQRFYAAYEYAVCY